MPEIVLNKNGDYYATVDGYIIYAEEFMKYRTASEKDKKYEKKLYESVGLAAANPAQLVPWRTAYCVYDKFDESDKFDENYECALAFRDYYRGNVLKFAARAEHIFDEYLSRRESFEPRYRRLPKAVFQGDVNHSNILVTPAGNFKGMVDFNLSGTETILNYAFCESFCYFDGDSEKNSFFGRAASKKRDGRAAKRLAWIGRYYKFTDAEREAFSEYYNIFAPFRWPYQSFFLSLLSDKQNRYGDKCAEDILDWTEYQMSRNDVSLLLPK